MFPLVSTQFPRKPLLLSGLILERNYTFKRVEIESRRLTTFPTMSIPCTSIRNHQDFPRQQEYILGSEEVIGLPQRTEFEMGRSSCLYSAMYMERKSFANAKITDEERGLRLYAPIDRLSTTSATCLCMSYSFISSIVNFCCSSWTLYSLLSVLLEKPILSCMLLAALAEAA